MADFYWICDRGATAQNELDISEIRFGDQYTHRAAKSINPKVTQYNLSFKNRPVAQITAIVNFLEDIKQGYQSFTWQPPDCPDTQPDVRVVCKAWNTLVPINGITSLTCTFKVTPL